MLVGEEGKCKASRCREKRKSGVNISVVDLHVSKGIIDEELNCDV